MNLTSPAEIRSLLERHGFNFRKALGQNFLIDSHVPERIAAASGADKDTAVLEIGPGIGCLTEKLAERAGRVVSVELDRRLEGVLSETLMPYDNVEVIYGDALKIDLAALAREKLLPLRPAVCANLPYNVTSPLISAFLDAGVFGSVTVMVQREAAQRMAALPGTAEYGAFSVYVSWHCEVKRLFDVPPSCFMPAPKVTSSVIRLDKRKSPPAEVTSEDWFFKVVRASFAQRRKTLANALSNSLPCVSRSDAEAALGAMGLDPRVRGETLSAEQFAKLSNLLYK